MAQAAVQFEARVDPKSIRKLDKTLAALGHPATARKVVRRGLRAGAKIIQAKIKAKAPRDTGKLRKQIKVRAMKRSRRGSGVMVRLPTRIELGINEKGNSYYPASIEYGWKHARSGKHIPPRPYMRPGFSEAAPAAKVLAINFMWEDLEKEAKKLRERGGR